MRRILDFLGPASSGTMIACGGCKVFGRVFDTREGTPDDRFEGIFEELVDERVDLASDLKTNSNIRVAADLNFIFW